MQTVAVQAGQYLLTARIQNLLMISLNPTFGGSVELYDDLLVNAGAIASYLPAAESDVYQEASDFYGGQKVYADIVDFASKVPAFDCGAYYSDVRSALTDVDHKCCTEWC